MQFKSRLSGVLIVFVVTWIGLILRLFQIQVVDAKAYQQDAEERRLIARRLLAPMRGRILDRQGRELARDEPCWGIAVHYQLLRVSPYVEFGRTDEVELTPAPAPSSDGGPAQPKKETAEEAVLNQFASRASDDAPRESPEFIEAHKRIKDEAARLWAFLEESGQRRLVAQNVQRIVGQVKSRRKNYLEHHDLKPNAKPVIREERECHPIIEGLSKRDEINIRLWHLPRFPTLVRLGALEITDSTRRVYPEGEALAHVVGLLAEADVDIIEKRPFVIDSGASSSEIPGRSPQQPRRIDWGGYRLGDMRGSTGVEWLAEDELRGQRGQVEEFIDGRPPERAEPRPGRDVAISIDARLQQRVYQVLHQAIAAHQQTQGWKLIPGASVVVLDVATREVLAMTSYPSFSPQTFREDYDELIDDQEGRPLINRAVQVQYCPGSIVKPITIVAAHEEGLIDLDTRLECRGALHPDRPGVFRCWRPAGHSVPNQHGMITAQEAIRGSCNVFCYRLGNEFCEHFGGPVGGVARMCEWLQRFGVGRLTEVGLPGEKKGFLPTPEWLQRGPLHSRQPVTADARNYAIGQGEVEVTPLQAANIAATLASGDMRPVTLRIGNDGLAVQRLPVDEAMWRAIRSGMYDVVNHPDGTAPGARLRHDGFCLCGKSGSAQTPRWPTEFRVRHAHGEEEIEAGSESEARRLFIAKHPQFKPADLDVQCVAWFPDRPAEEGRSYSHAWFAAFIQPMSGGSPAWSQPAPLAIVVLLEFGGSGGSVAAPLCRDVADMIIEEFPEYVRTQTESDALGSRFDFLDR